MYLNAIHLDKIQPSNKDKNSTANLYLLNRHKRTSHDGGAAELLGGFPTWYFNSNKAQNGRFD